jgi:hypothetical protein
VSECLWYRNCLQDLSYNWINSPVLAWAAQDSIGQTDIEVFARDKGEHLEAIKRQVPRSGVGTHTETIVTLKEPAWGLRALLPI